MKVIQLADGFYPLIGGGSIAIRTWIENMPEVEFEVVTNALRTQSLLERYPYSKNCWIKRFLPEDIAHSSIYNGRKKIPFFPYKIISEWVRFSRKINYLKRAKYDLLNFNGPLTNYAFYSFDRVFHISLLTKLNDFSFIKKPKVLTLHGTPYEFTKNKIDKENEERMISMFENIICVSPHIYIKVQEYTKKRDEKKNVWFIPNSINTKKFYPLSPEEKNTQKSKFGYNDKFIVIFVGQLTPVKNLNMLLEAWKKVINEYPNSALLIVGFGPEKEKFEKLWQELIIRNNLEFIGKILNVDQYLKISDLFVLPSITEGLSLSLLEAMATGLPVISTRVSGSIDIIKNEQNGILLPHRNSKFLAESIIKVIENKNLRDKISNNARETVRKEFSNEVVIPKLKRIYEFLIK